MSWIWDQLGGLTNLLLVLLLLIALSSPFETLGWWAGWSRRAEEPPAPPTPPADRGTPDAVFVVYLTGVAGYSGDFLARRERGFLDRIRARIPAAAIVDDVFPYSTSNNPLDGDRLLRGLWVWLHRWRLKIPNNVFDGVIALRNIGQTLVSADSRYGPLYNAGVGEQVAASLVRHGYVPGSPRWVHLVAYSGGAQIAVGIAPHLTAALGARVRVISLGGVYTDDPGIEAVHRLVDFRGTRDHVMPAFGWLLFPGRWRPVVLSSWNRARRAGRMVFARCGPISHIGARDYFARGAVLPDGQTHADHTADLVADTITAAEAEG